MAIVCQETPYRLKLKHRDHYCYKCRSILFLTELGKTLHISDENAKFYDFPHISTVNEFGPGDPVDECTFFRIAFLCKKCDCTLEIPTQITLEDTDKFLKKFQKRFLKKRNLLVERFFETKNGSILKMFKNIDDIENLLLIFTRNGNEIITYRSPILRQRSFERAHYFNLNKGELINFINNALLKESVLNTLNRYLSEYIDEWGINYRLEDGIICISFKIKTHEVEITFDTRIKSYKIKLENTSEKAVQKILRLSMSKNYTEDLKNILKDYKLSRKSFPDNMTALAMIMKKYLARTGNLNFFEQAYYHDYNFDGIVI